MEMNNLLQRIINAYSKKKNDWVINYSELLAFIENLVLNDESGRYGVFSTNTSDILTAQLIGMEEEGSCSLKYSGTMIESVLNFSFLGYRVKSEYEKMESNSELPRFPRKPCSVFRFPMTVCRFFRCPNILPWP